MPELSIAIAALAARGIHLDSGSRRPVGGGCIHAAWRLDGPQGPVFMKTSTAEAAWMLHAEADGLEALREAGHLRVPRVLGIAAEGEPGWLALEWLDLRAVTPASEHALGEALARQHAVAGPHFGWRRDNAIGATPQRNEPASDWAIFFAEKRIGFQLELGRRNGLPQRLLKSGSRLGERVRELLADHEPAPALLHGDLWSGNRAAGPNGPVVFDPAVHYGDGECDLAMTQLFGGFQRSFYDAYDALIRPAPGRSERQRLYQLYHVLNHANLFGGGYVGQAERLIEALL